MAFWGVEVKPGKHFILKATDATQIKRLHLSQATLGIGNATTTRSILQCIVGNKSPLFLCGLSPQKVDSCQLNIEFEEAEDVIFSVLGPLSVHLTGYFLGRGSTAFRLHDDESESFGEDIVDTDVEKGSSDDYDYSDSFINDDDPSARSSHISSTDDDDDEITIKERAAKKEKKKSKKGGRLMKKKFQVPDSESEDSVEKIPKVLSSEVRVTRSKALENGDKCEKKTSEATDNTLDKKKDKPSSSVVDDEEGKNMPENQKPATDRAIESSSNKKRKKDRKEETRARKKQALDKRRNTQVGAEKLPEPDKSSDEVTIEEITKGNVDGKVAAQGKKVSILYTAKLKDSGKLIESNSKEAPLRFRIGGEKVIKGLSIGVEGMRVGDKRRLIIPPSLGYSEEGLKKEDVPKNAWLVYEVEAVKVR